MRFEWYYLPPWHDSDDENQPRNLEDFYKALKDWELSIEGGGLWDFDKER